MEKVQQCDRLTFVSDPIELKSFLHLDSEANPEFYELDKKDISVEHKMKEYLGDIDFNFEKLDDACSFSHLTAARTDKIAIQRSLQIPLDVKLKTLKRQKEAIKVQRELDSERMYFSNLLIPMTFPLSDKGIEKVTSETKILSPKVELPEILLTIQIYRPILRLPTSDCIFVDQEFHVIGQNFLSELRDEIGCLSDYLIPGEFSKDPDVPLSGICYKDIYKSSFFYISGTFYNDLRNSECKDYSKPIIDWANSGDRGIGPFETKPMDKVQFVDLTLRLGYPYVYFHQGGCEHFLVFSDIRLLTKDDSLYRESYPRFSRHINKHRMFCMVCTQQGANWVVTENERLPDSPYFFCDHCFRSFNYKEDGSKIGEFKARKVIDRSVFT